MPNDCGCGGCGFCRHYAADAGFRAYMDARPAKLARLAAQRGSQVASAPAPRPACRWLGGVLPGQFETCPTCRGSVKLRVFACAAFGRCTQGTRVDRVACCDSQCQGYQAPDAPGPSLP